MLAIIPARAGSKGVPGKNKALIGAGLSSTIRCRVERARSVTGIILSTDDEDILALYRDRASVLALIGQEASLKTIPRRLTLLSMRLMHGSRRSRFPEALFVAQPITPLRTAADIDAAFELFKSTGCESLISACRAEGIRHRAACIA